jgi:hypothetical protein
MYVTLHFTRLLEMQNILDSAPKVMQCSVQAAIELAVCKSSNCD